MKMFEIECVYFRKLEYSHRFTHLMQFAVSHKPIQLVLLLNDGQIFSKIVKPAARLPLKRRVIHYEIMPQTCNLNIQQNF
jgi:hypothetical protein